MNVDSPALNTWQTDAGQMQQQQTYFDNSVLKDLEITTTS